VKPRRFGRIAGIAVAEQFIVNDAVIWRSGSFGEAGVFRLRSGLALALA
jgi:hypothetical protein